MEMGMSMSIGMSFKSTIFDGYEICLYLWVYFSFIQTKLINQTALMKIKVIFLFPYPQTKTPKLF